MQAHTTSEGDEEVVVLNNQSADVKGDEDITLYPMREFKGKLGMCVNVCILYSKEWYAYKLTNQSYKSLRR